MTKSSGPECGQVLRKILEALRDLRFGSVEITVHEGRIVQIERKEKLRVNAPCPDLSDRTPKRGAAREEA